MNERELFSEALQRSDQAERAAYLDQACAGDTAVRQRIEGLLRAHIQASEVLKASPPDERTAEPTPPPPTDPDSLNTRSYHPPTQPLTDQSGATPAGETKLLSTDEVSVHDGWFAVSGLTEFELLAELGRGGMGVVYKARHRELKRIVALKMILDGKHAGFEHRERFRIEAEAVARLRHPNIVQLYDLGEADGHPFVTLEMLEGGSLADRLKGTTQSGRAAAELVATLAAAMHAAHQAGIVHRDLKPPNVLFDRDGTPKITDFGLAKRLEIEEGHTQTGQVMGTPSYMAPEQAKGEVHEIGPPADIYALGAILYEMLTGRPPFKGSSMMETLHQVVFDPVVPPSRLQPRIARDLETICLKCLDKEPTRRYASASDLADDLLRYLDGRPIRARRTPLWERSAKWVRRHPATTGLIGATVAAVVALVSWLVIDDAERKVKARAEDVRVAGFAADCDQKLFAVQGDIANKNWADARLTLTNMLTKLKPETRLEAQRNRATGLLEQVKRGIQAAELQAQDRERGRLFLERRNEAFYEAFFQETRSTGLDLPAKAEKTRAAVRQALRVFARADQDDAWTLPTLPATFSAKEQTEMYEGCYELLLVLAEAVALPLHGEDAEVQAERGLSILDQAARLRPQPAQALYLRRAACLALKGDRAGEASARAEARRFKLTTAFDHFLAGQELYGRRDWPKAIEQFEAAVRLQPDHFWALCLGAIASLQTNQPGVATLGLSSCIKQEPRFAWLYVLRGFAAGQAAVQARTAGKTLKIEDGSIEAAVEGRFDAAEDDYRKALELLADRPKDELRWVVLVDRAVTRFQRGRLNEAVADLEEAIRLDGRRYLAFASLAQVLQRQQKWDEAVERFTQAIALKPEEAALYRGRAAVQQERHDQTPAHRAAALHDLEDAIRSEKPGNPVLASDQTQRGELLRRGRRFEEALAACDAALKVAPDNDVAHRLRVMVLLDLNRSDEVIRSCDGALAKGKPWPDIHEIRGLARASRGDYSGAIDDYSHALVLRPGQSRVLSSRGLAYLVSDAPELALHDFDEALRRDATNGEAHSGRGLALVLLGDYRGAIAEAEESLRGDSLTARRAYNAARVYAQAAIAAGAEVGEKGKLAVALVDRYQERAIALLKLALERTPAERRAAFWQSQVAADPALRSLQRRLRTLQPAGVSNSPMTRRNEMAVRAAVAARSPDAVVARSPDLATPGTEGLPAAPTPRETSGRGDGGVVRPAPNRTSENPTGSEA